MRTTFITDREARLLGRVLKLDNHPSPHDWSEDLNDARFLVDDLIIRRSATEWDGELPLIISADDTVDAPRSRQNRRSSWRATIVPKLTVCARTASRAGRAVINTASRAMRFRFRRT